MRNGTRHIIFTLVLLFSSLFSGGFVSAQDIPIGGWKMHLPYRDCRYVTGSSTTIWAATSSALFSLNKSDNSVQRITKIDGLSDLTIGAIGYNTFNGTLLVGYKNGNIDIIHGNNIVNLPDIKRAQIIGDKSINNFYFVGNLAYVATGFGIVVIDCSRDEVKDTYLIGPNGTYLTIWDIVSDATTIYVSTVNGVYHAPINDPFLSNYATWTKYTGIPNGNYSCLAIFNNKLIAGFNISYPVLSGGRDTVFMCDLSTSTWDTIPQYGSRHNIHDLCVVGNYLYMADLYDSDCLDINFSATSIFPTNFPSSILKFPQRLYVDQVGRVWEADIDYGLIKMTTYLTGESYYPNGPITSDVYSMTQMDGDLLVVPGGHDDAWNNVFNHEGFSNFNDGEWTAYSDVQIHAIDTLQDMLAPAIDPKNKDHFFIGTWGAGVAEITNGVVTNVFQDNNSTLLPRVEFHWVGIGDLKYDTSGNLWVTNSHVLSPLNVYKKDGTWQAFDFTGYIPIGTTVSKLLITKTGKKWMILPRGQGILVFDDKGTLSNTSDDSKRRLGFSAGQGNLPGTEVYSMAEDDDGNVWIGTDKGVAVFYCADDIFSQSGCEAQQILITQDTYVQILLETQTVTSIVVDGANRKWIGTDGGGVYLFSPDGQKELEHFTSENSPLLSDNIVSMVMNEKTGEIYFGTTKGIVSYRGEAITGEETMGDVYSFPNPVAHDYHGPIAITGLAKNADVKIADVRGDVVFKTTALGGQAIWDGNNFQGERAASGVYIVFVSNADGSEKAVTKILLIN